MKYQDHENGKLLKIQPRVVQFSVFYVTPCNTITEAERAMLPLY